MLNSQDQRPPSVDDIFGTVTCRECGTFWVKEYAPRTCTNCGVPVSSTEGQGMHQLIGAVQRMDPTIPVIHCPHCHEPYLKASTPTQCFRCHTGLLTTRPARRPRPWSQLKRILSR